MELKGEALEEAMETGTEIGTGSWRWGHTTTYVFEKVGKFLEVPNPELWAWYGAYDHVCLAQLFGRMADMPKHIPYWTNDLRQEWERKGQPNVLPKQKHGEHNALDDARHLRKMWNALFPEGIWK